MINLSKTTYFTICSLNYLPTAKILLDTLASNTLNEIYLIICDRKTEKIDKFLAGSNINIIFAEELNINGFDEFILRYSILEMNTSIKPFVFNFLFKNGHEKIFYFDPDISIESSLSKFEDILDEYDALVTPHLLSPYSDELKPSMDDISNSGVYNLGFLGLKPRNTSTFLNWWMQKCKYFCYSDIDNGLFTDQKFCNYLPSFIDKTKIYHGYDANIAYWNLHEREITIKDEKFYSNSKEAMFFHFSGIVYDENFKFRHLSKHESRFKSDVSGALKEKINIYLLALSKNDKAFRKLGIDDSYTFNRVNGIELDNFKRSYIKEVEKRNKFTNADEIDEGWFFEDAREFSEFQSIKRYVLGIYFSRKDLQDAFLIDSNSGLESFYKWINNEIVIGNIENELLNLIPDQIKNENRLSKLKQYLIIFLKKFNRKYPFFFSTPLLMKFKLGLKKILLKNYLITDKPSIGSSLFSPHNNVKEIERKGINLFGYFEATTGVAVGAKHMAEMLKILKMEVSKNIVSINDNSIIHKEKENQQDWDISLFHINADQMPNVCLGLDSKNLSCYKIGYWAWELERFPKEYLLSGKYLNDLWVPSNFIADSIERSCNFLPKVIPHPVVEHSTKIHNFDEKFNLKDKFFITGIMDLNSYVDRKNPFAILDAFLIACNQKSFKEDAALILKLSGAFKKKETLEKINTFRERHGIEVIIIDKILDDKEMIGLRNMTDIFVSLHRSEGFGLNLIENMSAGNIVIATNYSGNKDFMNEDNSLLVNYELIPVKEGQYPKWEGQFWADPSIQDAADKILWSFNNLSKAGNISKKGREFVLEKFSKEAVSKKVSAAIESIK